jgi:hypothetical protein
MTDVGPVAEGGGKSQCLRHWGAVMSAKKDTADMAVSQGK